MLLFSLVSDLIADSTAMNRKKASVGKGQISDEIRRIAEQRGSLCLLLKHKLRGLVCSGLISNCPTIQSRNIYSADMLIALMMIIITTITTVWPLGRTFSVGISSIIT